MGFRFLEHTADALAECTGGSFEDLLKAAGQALYAVALERIPTGNDVVHDVALEADGREELLVRWLQELIYLLDVERFVATDCVFQVATRDTLQATLRGTTWEPDDRRTEVKAATYHGLAVRESAEGFTAQVLFDL